MFDIFAFMCYTSGTKEEKMNLIENKSKVTKKDILKFLHNYSLKNLWIVILCAVAIGCFGFSIVDGKLVYQNFIFILFAILVVIGYYIALFLTFKSQLKNFTEINNTYSFEDDKINVVGTTKGETEAFHVKYTSLFRVKETKDSFYLFVNNTSALIVKKDEKCYVKGDSNKLKKLLEMKLNIIQNKMKKDKAK